MLLNRKLLVRFFQSKAQTIVLYSKTGVAFRIFQGTAKVDLKFRNPGNAIAEKFKVEPKNKEESGKKHKTNREFINQKRP